MTIFNECQVLFIFDMFLQLSKQYVILFLLFCASLLILEHSVTIFNECHVLFRIIIIYHTFEKFLGYILVLCTYCTLIVRIRIIIYQKPLIKHSRGQDLTTVTLGHN